MDLINLSIGDAAVTAVLGYAVVFFGLVLLMCVIMIAGKIMMKKPEPEKAVAEPVVEPEIEAVAAPGSAGELKLYDTDPRDAAMIMAIVADSLGKPINELRFKSIKEVK